MRRKFQRVYLLALFFGGIALITKTGCVESVTDSTSGTGYTIPTIEIASPSTGDTVYVGKNDVTYTASDPSGSGFSEFEVFINNISSSSYQVSITSSAKTKIYLDIPDTYLNQKISYYVIARSKSGKEKKSTVQTGLYVKPTPPKSPGKLRIAKENDTRFNLSWIDSSDNENRFEVWRKDGISGNYRMLKSLGENQFYTTDDVPSAYTIYFYKVRAGHSSGVSGYSNEVNTLIAPTNLAVKATAANTVELTWSDNSSFENGFRVERATAVSGEFEWIGTVPTNVTVYKDETVQTQTAYKYRVAAFTGTASSPYSAEVSITTPAADTPPAQLKADFNYTTRKIDVVWNSSNFNTITYIERKDGASGRFNPRAAFNNMFTRKFTDDSLLVPNTFYTYRVREYNYSGLYTAYSNEDTVFVPVLPPLAPSNFRLVADANNLTKISLFWNDNSVDEEGFELWRRDGLTPQYNLIERYSANFNGAVTFIPSANFTYYFKIRAYKGNLYSDFSNEISTSGTAGSFNLTAYDIGTNYLRIRWNDYFTNEVGFAIERKLSYQDDSYWTEIGLVSSSSGSVVSYTDNYSIQAGATYNYRVRAIFNQGYSEYSNILTVTARVL